MSRLRPALAAFAVLGGCTPKDGPESLLGPASSTVVRWRVDRWMYEMGVGTEYEEVMVNTDGVRAELHLYQSGQRWSGGPEPRTFPGWRTIIPLSSAEFVELRGLLSRAPIVAGSTVNRPSDEVVDYEPHWTLCVPGDAGEVCGTRYEAEWRRHEGVPAVFAALGRLKQRAYTQGERFPAP